MKLFLLLFLVVATASYAGLEVVETEHGVSAEFDGLTLWTFNHDPAEGKPYFHPLASTDGTTFTDLRPKDHPWHRGVWFSWKKINGVNYWEESRKTGTSAGETRIVEIKRNISKGKQVRFEFAIEYVPAGTDDAVMKESRVVSVSPPGEDGIYTIDWSSEFLAMDKDVALDRTPLPGQKGGKGHGGYAGWSVRMNKDVKGGVFLNSAGQKGTAAHRQPAPWMQFTSPQGSSLLFMDHPGNLRHPAKWFVAEKMPYFSPAVIHDAPHTIKAGESLSLRYRLVVLPDAADGEAANAIWERWAE